jgi:hypothetical protein
MPKRKDRTQAKHFQARRIWIHDGEREFAEAEHWRARAEAVVKVIAFWIHAAGLYSRAARLFSSGSLGLRAKEAYGLAADCLARAGQAEESQRIRKKAQFIPDYWKEDA